MLVGCRRLTQLQTAKGNAQRPKIALLGEYAGRLVPIDATPKWFDTRALFGGAIECGAKDRQRFVDLAGGDIDRGNDAQGVVPGSAG